MCLCFCLQSVVKTGRLLVAHEATHTMGFAAEIAATVQVLHICLLMFFFDNYLIWGVFRKLLQPNIFNSHLICRQAILCFTFQIDQSVNF